MKDNEVVELLEILINQNFEESLENGYFGDFYNIAKGDELLEHMLSYSNAETVLNNQLNEANQWIICQFENEYLDLGDNINRLIVEIGLNNNTATDITYSSRELTIQTEDFRSVSKWTKDDIPYQIIENWNGSLKEQLVRKIEGIDDPFVIRSLIKKLERLTCK